MVGPVHHELHARSDLAELADDESVAVPLVVVGDVALEFRVRDVGEVTHDDVGVRDGRLHVNLGLVPGYRVDGVRVRLLSILHLEHLANPVHVDSSSWHFTIWDELWRWSLPAFGNVLASAECIKVIGKSWNANRRTVE